MEFSRQSIIEYSTSSSTSGTSQRQDFSVHFHHEYSSGESVMLTVMYSFVYRTRTAQTSVNSRPPFPGQAQHRKSWYYSGMCILPFSKPCLSSRTTRLTRQESQPTTKSTLEMSSQPNRNYRRWRLRHCLYIRVSSQ